MYQASEVIMPPRPQDVKPVTEPHTISCDGCRDQAWTDGEPTTMSGDGQPAGYVCGEFGSGLYCSDQTPIAECPRWDLTRDLLCPCCLEAGREVPAWYSRRANLASCPACRSLWLPDPTLGQPEVVPCH